jgi:hypothetical protein
LSRHEQGDSNVTGGEFGAAALQRRAVAAIVNSFSRAIGLFLSKRRLCETPSVESFEPFRESQDAQGNRLTRYSPSETVAPRNRSLVIDCHANQFG